MGGRLSLKRPAFLMGASDAAASTAEVNPIVLRPNGELSIQVQIDNGSGANPSDSPTGTFQLWTTNDGLTWVRQTSTTIDAELAKLNTNTNTRVDAAANFLGVPGTACKVLYSRSSGGAASRCILTAVIGS